MRIEFLKTEEKPAAEAGAPPEKSVTVVGSAEWDGEKAVLAGSVDEDVGRAIMSLFAPIPVVTEDTSLRRSGSGPIVVQPGSLVWFREAAVTRASRIGLSSRVVAEPAAGEGFDPAMPYSDFDTVIAKIQAASSGS
jgi:hypothetical protein